MKGPKDPVDHFRTTRCHAGESMTDNVVMPALIVIGLALVMFVGCLAAFASGHPEVGLTVGSLAAGGFIVGSVWLAVEHLRVRHLEERWYAAHPGTMRQRPSS